MEVEQPALLDRVEQIIARLMNHEDHLSYSSLSAFRESPKDFINYKMGIKEETDAMLYGAMLHCLVLEPEEFDTRYHVLDDQDICNQIGGAKPRATKAYKEWKDVAMQEAAGKVIVETNDYLMAKITAENIFHNRAARKVLNLAPMREVPVKWEYLNFKFKGYKDGEGENCIFDLKVMPSANPRKVDREIIDRWLYVQAAMYCYGSGGYKPYYIIAVDKKNGVCVKQLHQKLVEQGMEEYDQILKQFNHCILTDAWDQSYDFYAERGDGIHVCEKPNWLY
jgi:hypothetical protein